MPQLIDPATPDSAKTRTGFDGEAYELVFSDEFETEGRTFFPGDDPYWEAVDLWYGATADEEWYDPKQITTKNGKLSILMENVANHGLQYRSGMLQSWNKFCYTTGYIEVAVSLPGPNQEVMGFVSFFFLVLLCVWGFFCLLFFNSGLVRGRWGIWGDLGMAVRRMAYGLIRASHQHSHVNNFVFTPPFLDTTHATSVRSRTRRSEMAVDPPPRCRRPHREPNTISSSPY
jgi:hypothetical protein